MSGLRERLGKLGQQYRAAEYHEHRGGAPGAPGCMKVAEREVEKLTEAIVADYDLHGEQGTWAWAVAQMRAGRRVRRWDTEHQHVIRAGRGFIRMDDDRSISPISLDDCEATDWQTVDDEETPVLEDIELIVTDYGEPPPKAVEDGMPDLDVIVWAKVDGEWTLAARTHTGTISRVGERGAVQWEPEYCWAHPSDMPVEGTVTHWTPVRRPAAETP